MYASEKRSHTFTELRGCCDAPNATAIMSGSKDEMAARVLAVSSSMSSSRISPLTEAKNHAVITRQRLMESVTILRYPNGIVKLSKL